MTTCHLKPGDLLKLTPHNGSYEHVYMLVLCTKMFASRQDFMITLADFEYSCRDHKMNLFYINSVWKIEVIV